MTEEWRPVVGYEGTYEVSSLGRLRNARRGTPRRTRPNRYGYPQAWLWDGQKGRSRPVHRLMGEAFLGAGPEDVVRHLNDVRDDNQLENLALGTHSDNAFDKVANGHHWNAEKTHCKHGHEFTPENTVLGTGGHRQCLTCKRDAARVAARRRRALRSAEARPQELAPTAPLPVGCDA